MTGHIHQDLADQPLSPSIPLVEAGDLEADLLVESRATPGLERVGPVRADNSCQARHHKGFARSGFAMDWDGQKGTGPEHQTRCDGKPDFDPFGNAGIDVRFPRRICSPCPSLALYPRSTARSRPILLRPRPQPHALQERRRQQETDPWRKP